MNEKILVVDDEKEKKSALEVVMTVLHGPRNIGEQRYV